MGPAAYGAGAPRHWQAFHVLVGCEATGGTMARASASARPRIIWELVWGKGCTVSWVTCTGTRRTPVRVPEAHYPP